jgi:hypothetical protein
MRQAVRRQFFIMAISFKRLREYLDAIAAKANLDAANAGHGVFWNVSYNQFITGTIPNKQCHGQPVPIIDPANKAQSAFFQILRDGWCGMPQMPRTGPFVTANGYSVVLSDGSVITGTQILKDIEDWLEGGALENG